MHIIMSVNQRCTVPYTHILPIMLKCHVVENPDDPIANNWSAIQTPRLLLNKQIQ